MVRRIDRYPADMGWTTMNLISTIGSFILAAGIVVTLVNIVISAKKGKKAGNDPWLGNTLEWFTSSPPPENNFDVIPRVRSVTPMQDIRREVAASTSTQVGSVAQPLV
jgi:cytochrome c oxidase subunit 1